MNIVKTIPTDKLVKELERRQVIQTVSSEGRMDIIHTQLADDPQSLLEWRKIDLAHSLSRFLYEEKVLTFEERTEENVITISTTIRILHV